MRHEDEEMYLILPTMTNSAQNCNAISTCAHRQMSLSLRTCITGGADAVLSFLVSEIRTNKWEFRFMSLPDPLLTGKKKFWTANLEQVWHWGENSNLPNGKLTYSFQSVDQETLYTPGILKKPFLFFPWECVFRDSLYECSKFLATDT
jgi:hypothetical protein